MTRRLAGRELLRWASCINPDPVDWDADDIESGLIGDFPQGRTDRTGGKELTETNKALRVRTPFPPLAPAKQVPNPKSDFRLILPICLPLIILGGMQRFQYAYTSVVGEHPKSDQFHLYEPAVMFQVGVKTDRFDGMGQSVNYKTVRQEHDRVTFPNGGSIAIVPGDRERVIEWWSNLWFTP